MDIPLDTLKGLPAELQAHIFAMLDALSFYNTMLVCRDFAHTTKEVERIRDKGKLVRMICSLAVKSVGGPGSKKGTVEDFVATILPTYKNNFLDVMSISSKVDAVHASAILRPLRAQQRMLTDVVRLAAAAPRRESPNWVLTSPLRSLTRDSVQLSALETVIQRFETAAAGGNPDQKWLKSDGIQCLIETRRALQAPLAKMKEEMATLAKQIQADGDAAKDKPFELTEQQIKDLEKGFAQKTAELEMAVVADMTANLGPSADANATEAAKVIGDVVKEDQLSQ